jgi:hypothetical protein
MARNAGFKLTLITGKEVEECMRSSSPMLENPNAYGVKVKFYNGITLPVRPSVFRSVYSHLVPPSEMLQLITILDETQRKINE